MILCAALLSAPVHAVGYVNGDALLKAFSSDNELIRGQAIGYVLGVHDSSRGETHCSPQAMPVKVLLDATTQMLQGVGDALRSIGADVLIATMLKIKFPCGDAKDEPAEARKLGVQE